MWTLRKYYSKVFLLLTLVMVLGNPVCTFANITDSANAQISKDIVITVNGEKVPFKTAIIDGSSYLPVRVIGYALNSTVEWKDSVRYIMVQTVEEKLPQQEFGDLVSIEAGNTIAYFVDDMHLVLNGNHNESVSSKIAVIENRSYLPVRAVSEQLGIRSTWNAETRTIEIVNPRTVIISEDINEYYVSDLPTIEKQEDYLIGNWKGNYGLTFADEKYNTEIFISKPINDSWYSDGGFYKIIAKNKLISGDKSEVGSYYIAEYKGVYNDKTNTLYTYFQKYLYADPCFGNLGTDRNYKLQGDSLHVITEYTAGKLERY